MQQAGIERICRLTPLQEGMFFEALRKQGSGEVIYQICLDLEGPVSTALMREAWAGVVRWHPILRTSFHYERLDVPVQVAHAVVDVPWTEHDWRGRDPAEHDLGDLLAQDRARPFDLAEAPLMRLTLTRLGDERCWLVWTYHHLLLDGWSTYLVLADVFDSYQDLSDGRALANRAPRPYWEYVAWLQQRKQEDEEEYWRGRLAGFTAPTALGYERVSGEAAAAEFDEVALALPDQVAAGLDELARRHHLTIGTSLQAAWAATLSRYTGSAEVVFGSIVSGRSPEFRGVDDIVGLFINVLPVRTALNEDEPLLDWLGRFQAQLVESRQYQAAPLAAVQRWSEVPRGAALFETLAVFINYPVREGWTSSGPVRVRDLRVLQQPHYPLHLTGFVGPAGWQLTIGFDPARFRRGTVRRLGNLLMSTLAAIAAAPGKRAGDLPRWTTTVALADQVAENEITPAPVADLIRATAARRPDAVAVSDGVARLTYRDLVTRAQTLAARLRQAGLTPLSKVRLCLPASPELIEAVLAVSMVGAAMRATDPDTPAGDPAGPDLVLTTEMLASLPAAGDHADRTAWSPGAPALLLPTEPGAALTQDGLARLLWWLQSTLPLAETDRVLQLGGPGRPTYLRDLLWVLAAGSTVVLPGPAGAGLPAEPAVTVVHAPASEPGIGGLATGARGVRRLLVAGPLPAALFRALTGPDLLDLVEEHGPTEPSWRSWFYSAALGGPAESPPAGRVLGHQRVFPPAGEVTDDDPGLWAVAAVLAEHPQVREAAVRALPGPGGEPAVVGYLVLGEGEPSATELAELVAARLPRSLVPASFVTLDAMPLAASGELDRSALPAPGDRPATGSSRAGSPTDVVAEVAAAVWAHTLDLPAELDHDASFFELGGHSLLAIKLVSRIRTALGAGFTLNDLFAEPTLAGVTRAARGSLASLGAEGGDDDTDEPIPRVGRGTALPASFAQERSLFFDLVHPDAPGNVLLPFRVSFAIDPGVLRQALAGLVERHEVLRTTLRLDADRIVQVISDQAEPPLMVADLSGLPPATAEDEARALLSADLSRAFDLGAEIPLRAKLIRLSDHETILGLCLHTAVMDGWSADVLFADLNALYSAAASGRPAGLPELPVQYADFSVWQRSRLSGARLERLVHYWAGQLAGAPEALALDGRSQQAHPDAPRLLAEQDLFIPPEVTSALRHLTTDESSTLSMGMLAVYAVLLGRHADRSDVVVGLTVAGRDHPQVENLVGLFVNTLPIRIDLSGSPSFRELLRRVRQACLSGLAHREMPLEHLASALHPQQAQSQQAQSQPAQRQILLVQAQYTFQNGPFLPVEFAGRVATYFPVPQQAVRSEINAELYEWKGGIRCALHHDTSRYPVAYMRALAQEYADLARGLTAAPDAPAAATDQAASAGYGPPSSREVLHTLMRARGGAGQ